jgi:hypothetical protein
MATRPDTPTACPACGGPRVASILYGLPAFSPELDRELNEGRVVLGGCCVSGDDPKWQCADCHHRWGRLRWPDPPDKSAS